MIDAKLVEATCVQLSAPFVKGVNIVIDLVDPDLEIGSRMLNKTTIVRFELIGDRDKYIEIDTKLQLWPNYNETLQISVDDARSVRDVFMASPFIGVFKNPVADKIQMAFWEMYGVPNRVRGQKFVPLSGENEQKWFFERTFAAMNALFANNEATEVFF